MIEIIIWFAAYLCPNPYHTPAHHGNCKLVHIINVASAEDDTGGETGGTPKPPVPPPPPPPPGA